MKNKLKSILKCKKGGGNLFTVAIIIIIFMLFLCVTEYFRLLIISQGIRDTLNSSVIMTVTENYNESYHPTREGYSGGYEPTAKDFEKSLDYGDIYAKLDDILGLKKDGKYHIKYTKRKYIEFKIYGLKVNIKNTKFAGGDVKNHRFKVDSSIYTEIPIAFLGGKFPPLKIKLKTTAGYTPKF